MINVTQNFYLDRAQIGTFCPAQAQAPKQDHIIALPNFDHRVATDATQEVKSAKDEQVATTLAKSNKKHVKRWIIIASWMLGMIVGLTLAITGAITVTPLMTQLGALLVTAFTGMGAKVVEFMIADKD